mmetsp:Transcript_14136/g.31743  ORF Transcript_14136/g.31743 Transcript_14136/m.31743 type:complete len:339 (-) Transcript_14136:556-1572(-)
MREWVGIDGGGGGNACTGGNARWVPCMHVWRVHGASLPLHANAYMLLSTCYCSSPSVPLERVVAAADVHHALQIRHTLLRVRVEQQLQHPLVQALAGGVHDEHVRLVHLPLQHCLLCVEALVEDLLLVRLWEGVCALVEHSVHVLVAVRAEDLLRPAGHVQAHQPYARVELRHHCALRDVLGDKRDDACLEGVQVRLSEYLRLEVEGCVAHLLPQKGRAPQCLPRLGVEVEDGVGLAGLEVDGHAVPQVRVALQALHEAGQVHARLLEGQGVPHQSQLYPARAPVHAHLHVSQVSLCGLPLAGLCVPRDAHVHRRSVQHLHGLVDARVVHAAVGDGLN